MLQKTIRGARISLTLTIVFMTISSLSLSLIPFMEESTEKGSSPLGYVIAATFWLGLIAALVSTYLTRTSLRRHRERLIVRDSMERQRLPGIINFSLNKKNIILYAFIVIGLVLIVTDIAFSYVPETIMFPIVSVTIILFTVHCVVDGKYYKAYQQMKECMKHETKD